MHYSPDRRCLELNEQLRGLTAQRPWKIVFLPSPEVSHWQYLPDDLAADCTAVSNDRFRIGFRDGWEQADVIITTAHGQNRSTELLHLRETNPRALIAVWLWDNHVTFHHNLATTFATDLYFLSHHYCAKQLPSPLAALAGHIPACCAQWSAGQLRHAMAQEALPRRNKVYAGYVDYPASRRHSLLARMQAQAPEVDTILMPPEDRSRYFSLSPADRLAEWLLYPASVVLPYAQDLSTRFFDALAAGQIPLIADNVADLDSVIAPAEQAILPILKFRADDLDDLRRAAREALRQFELQGPEGVRRRQNFVGTKHLLVHRILKMVRTITLATEGKLQSHTLRIPDEGISLVLTP